MLAKRKPTRATGQRTGSGTARPLQLQAARAQGPCTRTKQTNEPQKRAEQRNQQRTACVHAYRNASACCAVLFDALLLSASQQRVESVEASCCARCHGRRPSSSSSRPLVCLTQRSWLATAPPPAPPRALPAACPFLPSCLLLPRCLLVDRSVCRLARSTEGRGRGSPARRPQLHRSRARLLCNKHSDLKNRQEPRRQGSGRGAAASCGHAQTSTHHSVAGAGSLSLSSSLGCRHGRCAGPQNGKEGDSSSWIDIAAAACLLLPGPQRLPELAGDVCVRHRHHPWFTAAVDARASGKGAHVPGCCWLCCSLLLLLLFSLLFLLLLPLVLPVCLIACLRLRLACPRRGPAEPGAAVVPGRHGCGAGRRAPAFHQDGQGCGVHTGGDGQAQPGPARLEVPPAGRRHVAARRARQSPRTGGRPDGGRHAPASRRKTRTQLQQSQATARSKTTQAERADRLGATHDRACSLVHFRLAIEYTRAILWIKSDCNWRLHDHSCIFVSSA